MFLILTVLLALMVHFGYSQVPERWKDSISLRSFLNCIFYDGVLLVLSPIMLLYGSKELRDSIKSKCGRP